MAKTYNNYKYNTEEKSKVLPEKAPAASQVEEVVVEAKPEPKKEIKAETKKEDEVIEKRVLYYSNIRKAPMGEIIRTVQSGDILKIVGEKDGWSLLADGTYIRSDLVE